MVRHARSLIQKGDLGSIRVIQAEYPQDWLTTKAEDSGLKQAEWRTDPARSGSAGGVGDIGSHTMHLLEFVSGHKLQSVAADLTTFVEGRKLDDDASMLVKLNDNVKGSLWISQVAIGEENNFKSLW